MAEWLRVIRRGTHQEASEYIRWAYGTLSDFWIDIEPGSDSSDGGSRNEGSKYQENPDYQEQERVVLVPLRNPRRRRRGDQIALSQIKMDIERSKYKIFSKKHMSAGLTHTK